jgi:hypothetical protein
MTATFRKRKDDTFQRIRRALATSEISVKGKVAYGKVGDGLLYGDPSALTSLLPIGYFTENVTGDGTLTTVVELFREVKANWLANDSNPNEVDQGDVFSECYAKDGATVTMLSTSHSKAGRVWDVSADGTKVLVEAGPAVTGPSGSSSTEVGSVADRTALAAIAASARANGDLVLVRTDNSLWRFDSASVLTSDENKQLVVAPGAGTGAWIRADKSFVMKLAIDKTMADATVLLTVPAGMCLRLAGPLFWDITTGFTGGSASTIGIASSVTGYSTAGDLIGGAAGEATAVIGTAGVFAGTIGPKVDTVTEIQAFLLEAGKTVTYEKITSTYTAGNGFVCIPVVVELVG